MVILRSLVQESCKFFLQLSCFFTHFLNNLLVLHPLGECRATIKYSAGECDIYAIATTSWSHRRATTPPQGEDKPSPLLWTGLASRFVGIVGAHPCGRPRRLPFSIPTVIRQQSLCKGGSGMERSGDPCGRPGVGL